MNMAVAQEASEFGLGQKWPICSSGRERLRLSGFTRKKLCAAASYARMSGVIMPVMTATGSGNQGITLLLTIEGVAQAMGIDEGDQARAAALANPHQYLRQDVYGHAVGGLRVRRGERTGRVGRRGLYAGRRRGADALCDAEYSRLDLRHDLRRREGGLAARVGVQLSSGLAVKAAFLEDERQWAYAVATASSARMAVLAV